MDLIIVGAGGMGREIFSHLNGYIKKNKNYKIKGFIDDNVDALSGYSYPLEVIGTISDFQPQKKQLFVLAIMEPEEKRRIVNLLIQKGAEFLTFVHPTAIVGWNVTLGKGTTICPNCILTNDIEVGDYVFINTQSTIGHDSTIGNFTSINGSVEITGNSVVGEGCLFGVGAKLIPNRKIGDWATVGAGSVVIRNVKSRTTVFGNPAKKLM